MNIIITGASGSGGSFLAEYLENTNKKINLYGISRWHSTSTDSNLKNLKRIKMVECDLTDLSRVLSIFKDIKPKYIFHLASHANVRAGFDNPISVMNNNILSTINILEAIKILNLKTKVQICSTSEVYGNVMKKDIPIKESLIYRPASPYAVSKTTQDLLAQVYFLNYGMKTIITRMFAYINPRREDLFATSFAKQAIEIEMGKRKTLFHVG